jgi:hypothetical protein
MTKPARKVAARKARDANPKTTSKVGRARKKLAAKTLRKTLRKTDTQFEQMRRAQVPDTLQVLAEKNLAQTRDQYERSKNTLKAVLESWRKSFGAAGDGAVALNRKIVDITERNINTGFDLATGLVRAKNLTEVVELHAAYWRKLLGGLQRQAAVGRAAPSRTRARD